MKPDEAAAENPVQNFTTSSKRPLFAAYRTERPTLFPGDLAAVERGLGVRGLAAKQGQSKFRSPDRIGSPSADDQTNQRKIFRKSQVLEQSEYILILKKTARIVSQCFFLG